jgi:hypothetical protein
VSESTKPVIEPPQLRPGKVNSVSETVRIVAFFSNSALGNSAIQQLGQIGIPQDRLGVTAPERIASGQGMVLSIACPDPKLLPHVTAICKSLGASIHEQRGLP